MLVQEVLADFEKAKTLNKKVINKLNKDEYQYMCSLYKYGCKVFVKKNGFEMSFNLELDDSDNLRIVLIKTNAQSKVRIGYREISGEVDEALSKFSSWLDKFNKDGTDIEYTYLNF